LRTRSAGILGHLGTRAALFQVRPSIIWAFIRRQPASFWWVNIYLFFEYIRPQQVYETLAFLPWARFVIILATLSFLREKRRIRIQTPDVLLGLFTLVVVASSVVAVRPSVSYAALPDYLTWVLIYVLITNVIVTEERFFIFVLAFIVYNFKMSQFGLRSWAQDGFVFRTWGIAGTPGWFGNSGEFGIEMCVFLPLVLAFASALKRYWPPWKRWLFWGIVVSAVVGIVGSSSRGALLGGAGVALWIMLRSRHKFRAIIAIGVLATLAYFMLPPEQVERLHAMGDDKTSTNRTEYWQHGRDIMSQYPVLGIGYKNWADYHQAVYGLRALPHNIFIEAGAELGFAGLGMFIALIGSTLAVNRRTRKIAKARGGVDPFAHDMAHGLDGALIGFLVSGSFVTVLYYPYFWINFAMTVALNRAVQEAGAARQNQPAAARHPQIRSRRGVPAVAMRSTGG